MTIEFKDTLLFKPVELSNNIKLNHRVVYAPLTRLRNDPVTSVPNVKLLKEHYSQRSQHPGTLLVAESSSISSSANGVFPGAPGFWSKEQTSAWKEIIDEIHSNKSYIIIQLNHAGRQAFPATLKKLGFDYVAPSPVYITENPEYPFEKEAIESNNPLRELTIEEIQQVVEDFVQSSKNAFEAGADGVQVHAANGYLLNEFLDPETNRRTDKYGGSIENRSRLLLEIIDRLDSEFNGLEKISIRLSPFGVYGGLKGAYEDPTLVAQYAHVVGELEKRRRQGKELQFIGVVQPRYTGTVDQSDALSLGQLKGSTTFIQDIWGGKLIKNGSFGNNQELILKELNDDRTLISIGRNFIANPDLVDRLANGWELNKYDRSTFYTNGPEGYIDYPTYKK